MKNLTFWIKFLLFLSMISYVSALLLPYYFIYSRKNIITVTGLEFVVPLYSLLLLIPIYMLIFRKKGHVWLPFIFSFLLLIPVNFFQFILIDLNKYTPRGDGLVYPIHGYFAHILTTVLLVIASIRYIVHNQRKTNHLELLDEKL